MANFLIAPFAAVDTDGVKVTAYRLHWSNSFLGVNMPGFLTDLAFAIYVLIASPAVWLLGLLFDPDWWLGPLAKLYDELTAPLYAVVPPMLFAAAMMSLMLAGLLFVKSETDTFGSLAINRIAAGFGMMILIGVIAANPMRLLIKVMTFSSDLIRSVLSKGPNAASMKSVLVDSAIRTPAQMTNYGQALSDACSTEWSMAQANGRALEAGQCYAAGSDAADASTVIGTTGMVFVVGLPLLLFAGLTAWKFFLHMTLCALTLLTAPWQIGAAIPKRRGFVIVSGIVARFLAHLIVAVMIAWLAALLPTLTSELTVSIASRGEAEAGAALVLQALGFAVSWLLILKLANNHSFVVRMLRADPSQTLEATIGAKPAAALTKGGHAISDALIQRPYNMARSAYMGITGRFGNGLGADGYDEEGRARGPRPWADEAKNRKAFDARSVLMRASQRAIAAPRWQDAIGQAKASVVGDIFGYWWHSRRRDEDGEFEPQTVGAGEEQADRQRTASSTYRYAYRRQAGEEPTAARSTGREQGRHRPEAGSASPAGYPMIGVGGTGSDRGFGGAGGPGPADGPDGGRGPSGPSGPGGGPGGRGGGPTAPPPPNGGAGPAGPSGGPAPSGGGGRSDSAGLPAVARSDEGLSVRGNILADPELGRVAKHVGATFTPATSATPIVPAPPLPVFRTITGKPVEGVTPRPNGAIRPVAFNPPLTITPDTESSDGAEEPEKWSDRPFDPSAGLREGSNVHPGSFHAPLPDVLAGAQREVDFRKLRALGSRRGAPVIIRRDPDDPLIRMWFSNDPAHPVKATGAGFGDRARPRPRPDLAKSGGPASRQWGVGP